jgi:hypothetical protein
MRAWKAMLVAVAALLFAAAAMAAEDAFWHRHAAAGPSLALDHGRKWQTDAPLRQGMENIRAALSEGMTYEALAAEVRSEVAGIVQNCRLEPAADAQLHVVLIQLLAGAEAMEGKVPGENRRDGAERIGKALNAYGGHFDHEGWRDL